MSMRVWQDWRRFIALGDAGRRIVFYAEDGSSLPYLKPLVSELTTAQGLPVCYLTSSLKDPWLCAPPAGVKPFYIGDGFVRTMLFAGLRADVMVMTMPDLEIFHIKRSRSKHLHYVYTFHSMVSTHMIYRAAAFDHFDTILCIGPHQVSEIRGREHHYGLKPKDLVENGYVLLDELLAAAQARPNPEGEIRKVLVAPSWSDHGLLETRAEELTGLLLKAGYQVTVRPHPMTMRRHPRVIAGLKERFGKDPAFLLQSDITISDAFFQNDVMVSDWSGAALEFAFARLKPVVFVDIPRKVNNPDYQELGIEPVEASIREEIGIVVGVDQMHLLPLRLKELSGARKDWEERIARCRSKIVFNTGHSAACGGAHIAGLIHNKEKSP